MFEPDNFVEQLKELLLKLRVEKGNEGINEEESEEKDDEKGSSGGNSDRKGILKPSQIMVILAVLSGALEPISIIVDRNQNVQVVLSGTLRVPLKTDDSSKDGLTEDEEKFINTLKSLLSKI
ncbi:MAG: hypothetical protein ACPLSA_08190 [Caldanaerobacter sp.]|uniref:hypothetical protein n=1 Tax=Caldanaerobacter sp. TaxID=2930036 RepID=UPI003C70EA02